MYRNFAPKFPGRYLTSNVNITVAGPNGPPISVPVGSQFAILNVVGHFLIVYSILQVATPSSRRGSELLHHGMTLTIAHLACACTRGRKVTSLGVIFDFTGNDHNTTVQKVEDMVKEAWVSYTFLALKGS